MQAHETLECGCSILTGMYTVQIELVIDIHETASLAENKNDETVVAPEMLEYASTIPTGILYWVCRYSRYVRNNKLRICFLL